MGHPREGRSPPRLANGQAPRTGRVRTVASRSGVVPFQGPEGVRAPQGVDGVGLYSWALLWRLPGRRI
eukprot:11177919-Lingulodinium_polyedra.AAC.1